MTAGAKAKTKQSKANNNDQNTQNTESINLPRKITHDNEGDS